MARELTILFLEYGALGYHPLLFSNTMFFYRKKGGRRQKKKQKMGEQLYCGGTISLTLRFLMDTLFALSHLKVAVGPPQVMI